MHQKGRKLIWALKYADLDKKYRTSPTNGKDRYYRNSLFPLLCCDGKVPERLPCPRQGDRAPTEQVQPSLAELLVKMRFYYSTFSEKDCLPLQIFKD